MTAAPLLASGQLDLAIWRPLRFLNEDAHNHDTPTCGRNIKGPPNTVPALQPHFPQRAAHVLDVRLSNPFQAELFTQARYVDETGLHIGGQLVQLRIHNVVQGFYRPRHCGLLQYSVFAIGQSASTPPYPTLILMSCSAFLSASGVSFCPLNMRPTPRVRAAASNSSTTAIVRPPDSCFSTR